MDDVHHDLSPTAYHTKYDRDHLWRAEEFERAQIAFIQLLVQFAAVDILDARNIVYDAGFYSDALVTATLLDLIYSGFVTFNRQTFKLSIARQEVSAIIGRKPPRKGELTCATRKIDGS